MRYAYMVYFPMPNDSRSGGRYAILFNKEVIRKQLPAAESHYGVSAMIYRMPLRSFNEGPRDVPTFRVVADDVTSEFKGTKS